MRRAVTILALILGIQWFCAGQNKTSDDFIPVCDTLVSLLEERCGVHGKLELKAVMKRSGSLDFYFNETLGDYPWRKDDIKWFRATLKSLFPEKYRKYRLGDLYSRKVNIDLLATPRLTSDGDPVLTRYRTTSRSNGRTIVEDTQGKRYRKGLSGRHIALWQSHGRYFDQSSDMWIWQRPCLFTTCEDMFTQGFVLPYLVPMLENAGAYVLMPRERDIQKNEIIADNDSTSGWRGKAEYSETGKWKDAGAGFADAKEIYSELENPFRMGTARKAQCVRANHAPTASITWRPEIPERGHYAVYISYKTLPNSTSTARYSVTHLGGESRFTVNQKMGGGTWIYLGTFEFEKGSTGYVTLDNGTPEGQIMEIGSTVTADAVRFGGGMGNIARKMKTCPEDSTTVSAEASVSGLPRSAEAARYWLQWAGADSTVYYQNNGQNDYRDDFMSRGDWVEWISRDSWVNPNRHGGLGIPVDLSFGFHSDAGVTPNDSIVGTLAIYTYRSEGKTVLPAGEDRMTSRLYADLVQSQIVQDLQSEYDSLWRRRGIWDRGYRESRTPACPAMLLELLSHQNFADMKHGLDPSFRFAVSRSIYKGMLKYLSYRYNQEYVVQPLPVSSAAATFGTEGKGIISWKPVEDPLEPTASADGFILYSRVGDGGFDTGRIIKARENEDGTYSCEVDLIPGNVMSYRIAAFNDGGVGFPSETVSIGLPASTDSIKKVLIVNNFDRVCGPVYFEGEERAGFDCRKDGGVPYIQEITHVGEMHNFRRKDEWISNDSPGFGASYSDMAGEVIAGNTFDFPSVHGRAVLAAGYGFCSCSNERFCNDTTITKDIWTIDMICGKQVTTPVGNKTEYAVFPSQMQKSLTRFAGKGGNILVSGAYIGTDLSDCIYPGIQTDSTSAEKTARFAKDVLGYRHITGQAAKRGKVTPVTNSSFKGHDKLEFTIIPNSSVYCVESPDGLAPAAKGAKTIYRYADSGISAGVAYEAEGYRCVSLGFPIETLCGPEQISSIITTILDYFRK